MAVQFGVVLLLVTLTFSMVANSFPTLDAAAFALLGYDASDTGGQVGDFIGESEEMMMESESSRRTLLGQRRYISYGAMKKGSIPCNRRGASYYACNSHGAVNPYTRGCTRISRCARNTR